jgi:hypothetical protein
VRPCFSPAAPSFSLPLSHGGTHRAVERTVRRGLCRSPSKRARDGGRGTERDGSVPFPGRRCEGENGKSDLEVAFPARSRPPVQTVLEAWPFKGHLWSCSKLKVFLLCLGRASDQNTALIQQVSVFPAMTPCLSGKLFFPKVMADWQFHTFF